MRTEAANDAESGAGDGREEKAKRPSQPPSQTLVRGLAVLRAVAHQPRGLTVAEIAARTGLHRTVVHRLAGTLAAEGFLAKSADGAYVPGGELHTLAGTSRPTLAEFIQPLLQQLADRYGGTAILFFPEPDCVVAVATAVPQDADYHLAYRKGSRQPLDRGPPHARSGPDERLLTTTRTQSVRPAAGAGSPVMAQWNREPTRSPLRWLATETYWTPASCSSRTGRTA